MIEGLLRHCSDAAIEVNYVDSGPLTAARLLLHHGADHIDLGYDVNTRHRASRWYGSLVELGGGPTTDASFDSTPRGWAALVVRCVNA